MNEDSVYKSVQDVFYHISNNEDFLRTHYPNQLLNVQSMRDAYRRKKRRTESAADEGCCGCDDESSSAGQRNSRLKKHVSTTDGGAGETDRLDSFAETSDEEESADESSIVGCSLCGRMYILSKGSFDCLRKILF